MKFRRNVVSCLQCIPALKDFKVQLADAHGAAMLHFISCNGNTVVRYSCYHIWYHEVSRTCIFLPNVSLRLSYTQKENLETIKAQLANLHLQITTMFRQVGLCEKPIFSITEDFLTTTDILLELIFEYTIYPVNTSGAVSYLTASQFALEKRLLCIN